MLMAIEFVREEMYSFTPNDGGDEVLIFSGRLRKWLLGNAMDKVIDLTFPADETEESLIARHGLEAPRMASMTEEEAQEPVIVGLWPGGTHVLIDGAHRRWFWAKRGVYVLHGWAVPHEVWRAFVLEPDQLKGMVHHARDGALLPQRRGS